MANPFSKGWKYLTASLDQKIDENADPLVQIKQATDAAKQQHQQIAQQAASVIGNKNQLEMKLNRLLEEQKTLTEKARQAIQLAAKAQADGDAAKATEYGNVAEIYATQLVTAEQQLEETKTLHAQSVQAAAQATEQVKQSEARLTEQLSQIDQLTQQVQQTKMQEASNKALDSMKEFEPDNDVPSLDAVREKIERRYANALGSQELMQSSMGDRLAEIDATGTDFKAASRLEEIRASMKKETAALEAKPESDAEAAEATPAETTPAETEAASDEAKAEEASEKKDAE